MKILVTGDLHGDFGQLNRIINIKHPDLVICCGDFGYWPNFQKIKKLTDIKNGDTTVLWIDGNHEDHWSLSNRKSDELAPGIIYQPRGSTYTLEDGRRILFMGGADSIDKNWRTVGVDWFPEEIIKPKDLENLPNENIDIFITHTCPNELVLTLMRRYPEKNFEPSNHALSELWKRYKPSLWIFGHWHQYIEGMLENTKWYCLSHPRQGERWWMWLPDKEVINSIQKEGSEV